MIAGQEGVSTLRISKIVTIVAAVFSIYNVFLQFVTWIDLVILGLFCLLALNLVRESTEQSYTKRIVKRALIID